MKRCVNIKPSRTHYLQPRMRLVSPFVVVLWKSKSIVSGMHVRTKLNVFKTRDSTFCSLLSLKESVTLRKSTLNALKKFVLKKLRTKSVP